MKKCNKCKTILTNKIKICPKCGMDVSKIKQLTNTNNINKTKNKKIKTKKEQTYINKIFKYSIFTLIILIITIFWNVTYTYASAYKNNKLLAYKATDNKIFKEGDNIIYKGVIYKLVNINTSKGNYYKKPKDGNIYLIVTIYIENKTDKNIKYNYENFTISTKDKEEVNRIFSSINANNALYQGTLKKNNIKRGSMVFEVKKYDKKVRLNFIDNKKRFSISIKIPNNKI